MQKKKKEKKEVKIIIKKVILFKVNESENVKFRNINGFGILLNKSTDFLCRLGFGNGSANIGQT